MLANCVSPLHVLTNQPDQGQMTAYAHQYDEQQNGVYSLLNTAYIHFTYKTVLSCPTLIGSHQITLSLIWPFPHSFLILLLLLFSLHQAQHDSTVSLCLGRGLSRTSRIPARRLLTTVVAVVVELNQAKPMFSKVQLFFIQYLYEHRGDFLHIIF